jgi:hypothetical protein
MKRRFELIEGSPVPSNAENSTPQTANFKGENASTRMRRSN